MEFANTKQVSANFNLKVGLLIVDVEKEECQCRVLTANGRKLVLEVSAAGLCGIELHAWKGNKRTQKFVGTNFGVYCVAFAKSCLNKLKLTSDSIIMPMPRRTTRSRCLRLSEVSENAIQTTNPVSVKRVQVREQLVQIRVRRGWVRYARILDTPSAGTR